MNLARFRNYFFAGLMVLLPVIVTVLVVRGVVIWMNAFLLERIMGWLHIGRGGIYLINAIKVAIFIGLILGVWLVGFAARNIIIRKIFRYGERIFYKVPMVNKIYLTTRQISQAFLGEHQGVFQRVVLLEYPRKGIYSMGFVTSRGKGEIQQKTRENLINVFIPTTPNPTSGLLIMVPEEDVTPLEMSVGNAMKLVVSGGAVTPDYEKLAQK